MAITATFPPAWFVVAVTAAMMLVGSGGRDQLTLARLAPLPGRRRPVTVVALAMALASAALLAWLGGRVPSDLAGMVALAALVLAGLGGLLAAGRKPSWEEPTHSLGALALLLLAQMTFSARGLAAFALAAGFSVNTGLLAGALVGVGLSLLTALRPGHVGGPGRRRARRLGGALLLAATAAAFLR